MAALSTDELEQQLQALKQGKLSRRAAYHAVHEFGRGNFLFARPEVERLLTGEDAQLRSVALEVVTRHWRLQEHWETAKRFLEEDPDTQCRMQAASGLEVLKRNTGDRETLRVLASVVRNDQQARMVREAAYAAMRGVIDYQPREQMRMASKGLDLDRDIDWNMVDRYGR